MGLRLVNIDRQTPMLLPPDLRDWVQGDDLAHFIIDALEAVDLSLAALNVRGTGSEQYPPGMMLGLLIYCYAQGIFSSRQIERATRQHVSVRYLSGDTHPDHDTIAKFRRENGELLRSAFVQVLRLAKASGLLQVGAIAIDGTKLKGSAAKSKTMRLSEIEREIRAINVEVGQLLKRAEAADQSASEADGELPAELAEAQTRHERLVAAKAELERQARELHEERERQRAREAARGVPRRAQVKSVAAQPQPGAQINPSDPESGLMPTAQQGYIQGYNAQVAVSVPEPSGSVGLIVAAEVVREANDMLQLEPMSEAAIENLQEAPSRVLADTGYDNTRQILGLEERHGLQVLCPPARNARLKAGHVSRYRWDRQRYQARQNMRHRLQEPEAKALYKRRGTSVEPAIGIVKNAIGFNRFRLRGLEKVGIEWTLVSLAFNCRRLAAAKPQWN
jgi:transposase/IS5 family transposase